MKKAFTLIEILIALAIIGTLTAVGAPVIQGFITSSKESAAKENLQSIAFMQQDQFRESSQYYPCPEKILDTSQLDKQFFGGSGELSSGDYSYKMTGGCSSFDASAIITNSQAKCFKIDQDKIISTIACPKTEVKPLNNNSFSDYKTPVAASKGNGSWVMVDSKGMQVKGGGGGLVCSMSVCGPGGSFYKIGTGSSQHGQVDPSLYKYVFEQPANPKTGNVVSRAGNGGMSYNFSTGVWTTKNGAKYDTNGNQIK